MVPVLYRKLKDMSASADMDETIRPSVALLLFQTQNLIIFTFSNKDFLYVDTAHDFVRFHFHTVFLIWRVHLDFRTILLSPHF